MADKSGIHSADSAWAAGWQLAFLTLDPNSRCHLVRADRWQLRLRFPDLPPSAQRSVAAKVLPHQGDA